MRTSERVERILKVSKKARNSDAELIIAYLNDIGMNLNAHQENLLRDVNFESIRRTRQKFQEQGKYLADEPIAKERKFKSMQMQQVTPKVKPEKIDRYVENFQEQFPTNLHLLDVEPIEQERIDLG